MRNFNRIKNVQKVTLLDLIQTTLKPIIHISQWMNYWTVLLNLAILLSSSFIEIIINNPASTIKLLYDWLQNVNECIDIERIEGCGSCYRLMYMSSAIISGLVVELFLLTTNWTRHNPR